MNMFRKRWAFALLVFILACYVYADRRYLAMRVFAFQQGGAAPLLEKAEESPDTRWFDDYFTVDIILEDTYAIGEPRFWQQNYSYLIVGTERAVLFDAGPGIRDIRAVAESLTDLPITFIPSHLHYDHTGNTVTFDQIALIDVPATRSRARGDTFTPGSRQHLGFSEGIAPPTWEITEWLEPGSEIDLGERKLEVFFTPGHTDDSVSLFDNENDFLFSGDFLYPGPLYAFLPTSSMRDYLNAATPLARDMPPTLIIFGAHRDGPPGLPELEYQDLADLQRALRSIYEGELDGEGNWPQQFPVNDRILILAEPRWMQDW